MSSFKVQRTAELLMSFLARELCTRGEDELGRITLTAVDLSPDLKSARIFWTYNQFSASGGSTPASAQPLATDAEIQQVEAVLREAKPHLRKRVADELNLRYTPNLEFRYDRSVENGSRIEALLKQVSSGS